jgi:hypothetical protein
VVESGIVVSGGRTHHPYVINKALSKAGLIIILDVYGLQLVEAASDDGLGFVRAIGDEGARLALVPLYDMK